MGRAERHNLRDSWSVTRTRRSDQGRAKVKHSQIEGDWYANGPGAKRERSSLLVHQTSVAPTIDHQLAGSGHPEKSRCPPDARLMHHTRTSAPWRAELPDLTPIGPDPDVSCGSAWNRSSRFFCFLVFGACPKRRDAMTDVKSLGSSEEVKW